MTRSFKFRPVFIGLAALLAGCGTLRTPYQTPAATLTPTWIHGQAAGPQTGAWWRRFGDPTLDALVDRVLSRDNDLAAAAVTLRRARLKAHYAVINPTISGSGGYSDSIPLRGQFPSTRTGTASLLASYEVDLFGALAAQKDVARWEARATEQDLESTRLSLIGTTVDLYYQLAYLNQRVAMAQQSVAYGQKTLDLVRIQARAGAASSLEVAESVQSLASQKASLEDLIEQRVEARASLNLLLDGQTAAPDDELAQLPDGALPGVDADLPASLLGRRPDLRASELRLRESLASVDQSRLAFYPSLSLTGSVGGTGASLSNLLQNPVGTLGANIALPFLQYDQLRLNVGVSRASYDGAVIQFRQTLYKALTDVDNALSARDRLAAEAADLEESLTNARTVERLDEVRYRAGATPLKTWIDAQETRRQAEVALAQNRFNRYQNYVTLCTALGGDPARAPGQDR